MGNFEVMREAFTQAKDYQRQWDEYNEKVKKGDKTATPPKKDLKLDALVQVLQGKMLVQIHCYRADEFLTEIAIANEFGYKIRAFHHALEAYKVPEALAKNDIAIATFADWWGFKYEAWDAIPWNAVMAMRAGVRVAIKSDSDDYMRRLNQEAAKTMRYGGATEDEAMKMMTINPAWIMGVEDKTGSIDVGKDADLVLWDGYPLSSYGVPAKVWIDGDLYFDRALPGLGMPQVPGGSSDDRKPPCASRSSPCCSSVPPSLSRKSPATKPATAPALDPNKPIAITGGKLLTITHGTIENGVLVIENGKITAVGAAGSVKVPANAQVIDAKGMTVYPGLIDSESHLGLTEIEAEQDDQRPGRTQRRDHAAHARGRRLPRRVGADSGHALQRHHQRDCRARKPRHSARPGSRSSSWPARTPRRCCWSATSPCR